MGHSSSPITTLLDAMQGVGHGHLGLQPWGITTPAGAGWEHLGQAGTQKGQLISLSHRAFQKRQSWAWDGWAAAASPSLLTLMAQSKEGQQRQAELKLSGNSQTSAKALGSVMITRHICRNYQHELTSFLGKALPTEAPHLAHFLIPVSRT